jgi:hypothetical protein
LPANIADPASRRRDPHLQSIRQRDPDVRTKGRLKSFSLSMQASPGGIEHVRTRHYSDVCSLYTRFPEMSTFVRGSEFRKLARDAIEIGNENFGTKVHPDLNLAKSPALNLKPEQIEVLGRQYKAEAAYYFKGQPPFGELLPTLDSIRDDLTAIYK